jgi:folate-binding protein YgfZ
VVNPSASELLTIYGCQAPLPGWTVVAARGRDAERFLHSQVTSDVKGLAVGASQQTALLDRGGRLQAFGFLCRRDDRFELLLPESAADGATRHLEEHIIADDVQFEKAETPGMRIALGAEAVRLAVADGTDRFPIDTHGSRGFVTWGGDQLDLPTIGAGELEARRVLSGLPRWGEEAAEGVLIHQTTLIDSAVSMDKGCYLGQETVAKVASGRGAARAPMLLEVVAGDAPGEHAARSSFSTNLPKGKGEVLGLVEWDGRTFLLARVTRELRVADREIECRVDGGPVLGVRVHSLPFLTTPDPGGWAREIELRAVEAFTADREDEAINLYERAVAVCPTYADAYEALGVVLGRHRRFEEAIGLMKKLLEVEPQSVMAHTNLSLYYNQLGRIEDAEHEAAEAMRAKLRREQDEQHRTEQQRRRSEAESADRKRRADMFRQVLDLDPDDPLGNFGLGELLVEEGRFTEATVHLERALASDPRYSAALLALGRAHEGAEDLSSARETYRRGVEVAASKGDLATANKMQERLAALDDTSPDS